MANKKPRTPQPPRGGSRPPGVQAPKTRADDVGRRHGKLLYWVAGGGAVVLIAVVLAAVLGSGGSGGASGQKKVASLMAKAGCSFKTVDAYVPKGQNIHVPSLTKNLHWNTDPPSNGQHYPLWAVWGFYTQPINPHYVVHNEEHGGVILWWGPQVPQATVSQLRTLYDQQPVGVFGTPYKTLGTKVAITAWTGDTSIYGPGHYGQGHIGICPSYTAATEKAFVAFRDAYRGKGPEGVPLSADKPGMGPHA